MKVIIYIILYFVLFVGYYLMFSLVGLFFGFAYQECIGNLNWFEEVWLMDVTTTGIGATQKTKRKIITSPGPRDKNLGLKSAAQLGTSFPADKVSELQAIFSK